MVTPAGGGRPGAGEVSARGNSADVEPLESKGQLNKGGAHRAGSPPPSTAPLLSQTIFTGARKIIPEL